MSIWTDLLFLHGHIATPTGLAAAAPHLAARDDADPAPAAAPIRAAARPTQPRVLPPAHRISPNDLW